MRRGTPLIALALLLAAAITVPLYFATLQSREAVAPASPDDTSFTAPQAVTIEGYTDHAMEPFLTRDGRYLFFNNRNDPADQTDLHVARRINDLRFTYLGRVEGANSAALDGVASADRQGRFYFISTRDYDATGNTLWGGRLEGTRLVVAQPLLTDFTPRKLLRLNIDMEISAEGDMLYVAENRWDVLRRAPATSDLAMAARDRDMFRRLPNSDALMRNINSKALEFAPATSADQLTLYFTRLDMKRLRAKREDAFMLMVSTRPNRNAAWRAPKRIAAMTGYVEAPTVTPDGCALYFHRNVAGRFAIVFARRQRCPRPISR